MRPARLVAMLRPAVLGGVEGIRGERSGSPERHPKMRCIAPAPAHTSKFVAMAADRLTIKP